MTRFTVIFEMSGRLLLFYNKVVKSGKKYFHGLEYTTRLSEDGIVHITTAIDNALNSIDDLRNSYNID